MTPLWVFGYGSLMWNPGFPVVEARRAQVRGLHRSLCIYSVVHRGTARVPGLVFGLDHGGMCDGVAFRVADEDAADVLTYLGEREQVTGVYRKTRVLATLGATFDQSTKETDALGGTTSTLAGGEGRLPADSTVVRTPAHTTIAAVCYRADRTHPQYTGPLTLEHQARIVTLANGLAGRNLDYVVSTSEHLQEVGITDRTLLRLDGLLRCAPGAIANRCLDPTQKTGATPPWAHRKRLAETAHPARPIPSDPIARGAYRRRLGL